MFYQAGGTLRVPFGYFISTLNLFNGILVSKCKFMLLLFFLMEELETKTLS